MTFVREPGSAMHDLVGTDCGSVLVDGILRVCVEKQEHDAEHVARAIALFESVARGRCAFIVPELVERGTIYDWADPATNSWGQCWTNDDGTAWIQDPLGEKPVILQAVPPSRRRR